MQHKNLGAICVSYSNFCAIIVINKFIWVPIKCFTKIKMRLVCFSKDLVRIELQTRIFECELGTTIKYRCYSKVIAKMLCNLGNTHVNLRAIEVRH